MNSKSQEDKQAVLTLLSSNAQVVDAAEPLSQCLFEATADNEDRVARVVGEHTQVLEHLVIGSAVLHTNRNRKRERSEKKR